MTDPNIKTPADLLGRIMSERDLTGAVKLVDTKHELDFINVDVNFNQQLNHQYFYDQLLYVYHDIVIIVFVRVWRSDSYAQNTLSQRKLQRGPKWCPGRRRAQTRWPQRAVQTA